MVTPSATMGAFVMNEVVRDAVVMLQAAKDPEWKWWLTFVASVLGPLLSTVGSIYVAWKVFSWQGSKDRAAWVRDQEKSEWSSVLASLTLVDMKLPHVFANLDWFTMTDGMLQDLRNVLPSMRNALFIAGTLEKRGVVQDYVSFVSSAAEWIWEIRDLNEMIKSPPTPHSIEDASALNALRIKDMQKREKIYVELRQGFHSQANRIRSIARAVMLPELPSASANQSEQVEAAEDVGQSATGGGE